MRKTPKLLDEYATTGPRIKPSFSSSPVSKRWSNQANESIT